MVVTVEPGIYIDGRFGIRIEDTVVVGDPPRRLTRSNVPLLELR
jgi:Xaa-Pro aminopeptidase